MKDITFKDCQKAVNQAKYGPTAGRKALALKLLKELTEAISNLEEVEGRKSKPNPLARRASAGRPRNRNEKLERQQARANVSTTYIKSEPEPSYKAPRSGTPDYVLSEGETVEMAMVKLRAKLDADAVALVLAEFEEGLESPF
jgi:hypothetical protein